VRRIFQRHPTPNLAVQPLHEVGPTGDRAEAYETISEAKLALYTLPQVGMHLQLH